MPALIDGWSGHARRPALLTTAGQWVYGDLDAASRRAAAAMLAGRADLEGARVALLAPPGVEFVGALAGIWRAGGVAVPLAVSHPPAELDYVIRDARASIVITTLAFAHVAAALAVDAGARPLVTTGLFAGPPAPLPAVRGERPALLFYTSGTTGRPKGVVVTHDALDAQIASMTSAWRWTSADRALLVLPLHHVHGLVNVVATALGAGALCEMLPRFEAGAAWARLASGEVTVFTAVPTIYHRLIEAWDAAPVEMRQAWSSGARRARLMMSGSSALPAATLERWREITGLTLLERYGMTETGMILSNPLDGDRVAGHVGRPMPGVDVRLVDDAGAPAAADGPGPGEIEVRGPGVFRSYWERPDETRAAFHDGWFRTGDVALREAAGFRLLGRRSVDIIKTGGYKVSALEIEEALRGHPSVAECAVVSTPDREWGERVCAAVELRPGTDLTLGHLQAWLASRLAPYKIPRSLRCVPSLPRNAMGKVVKPDVQAWFGKPGGRG